MPSLPLLLSFSRSTPRLCILLMLIIILALLHSHPRCSDAPTDDREIKYVYYYPLLHQRVLSYFVHGSSLSIQRIYNSLHAELRCCLQHTQLHFTTNCLALTLCPSLAISSLVCCLHINSSIFLCCVQSQWSKCLVKVCSQLFRLVYVDMNSPGQSRIFPPITETIYYMHVISPLNHYFLQNHLQTKFL